MTNEKERGICAFFFGSGKMKGSDQTKEDKSDRMDAEIGEHVHKPGGVDGIVLFVERVENAAADD